MKQLVLISCLLVASLSTARADDQPPGVNLGFTSDPAPRPVMPNRPLRRRLGLGLVITSAVLLAHGILFVGLAKHANDDIFAHGQYHPHDEHDRDAFQITHAAFFIGSVATFIPGMVLIWDR